MARQSPDQVALSTLIQQLGQQLEPILSIPKRYLNEQEASRYLGGLSVHSLRQWRSKGTGPDYLHVGTRVIYDVKDLDVWMKRHQVKGDR